MNNYDLLNLLGKIDRKYYDEALGGDPQKPLRIDVSRKPVKWYHIAAPIAACLVICLGVIFLPHAIGNIQTGNSEPVSAVSDPNSQNSSNSQDKDNSSNSQDQENSSDSRDEDNSSNSQDQENSSDSGDQENSSNSREQSNSSDPQTPSTPVVIENYYEEYPMYDPESVPKLGSDFGYFVRNGSDIKAEDRVNTTFIVKKFGEYDICLTGATIYRPYDNEYVDAEHMGLSLVKDGIRVSYAEFPERSYDEDYSFNEKESTIDDIYEFPDFNVGFVKTHRGYFFSVEDGEIFLLRGTCMNNYYNVITEEYESDHGSLTIEGNSLIDKEYAREYRFDPKTFGKNSPEKMSNFATYFRDADKLTEDNFFNYYPELEDISPSMPDSKSNAVKRVLLDEVQIRSGRIPNGSSTAKRMYVSLIGENVYRPQNDPTHLHMDKMSVVMHEFTTVHAAIELDMSDAFLNGEITVDPNGILALCRIGGCDIVMIRDSHINDGQTAGGTFIAARDYSELIQLSGTDKDNNAVVYNIETADNYVAIDNDLIDIQNGIRYTFFPEMFDAKDPDAAHAHFKRGEYSFDSTIKGGASYKYGTTPDYESELECGTQEDLDRWNSFIAQAQPAVIHHVYFTNSDEERSYTLPDNNASAIFAIIKDSELGLTSYLPNPPTGGMIDPYFYNDYPGFIAFDSSGNYLFGIYYTGSYDECVEVCFDDLGKRYMFDASKSNIGNAFMFVTE